jgi:hypothetical protein
LGKDAPVQPCRLHHGHIQEHFMIVRIEIDAPPGGTFDYRVTHEGETLYGDTGLESLADALVAAVEGLAPEVVGAEIWYLGIVSGTYPLPVIAGNHVQIAAHAAHTTEAIREAMPEFE